LVPAIKKKWRSGGGATEKEERKCITDLKMRHDHRNKKKLQLAKTEEELLHVTSENHCEKEDTLARLDVALHI